MSSLNKVMLIGNLGNDPEMRYTNNGKPVANFRMATTETWNDKDGGGKKEATEWHRIVVFGPLAESVTQYLRKGRQAYVEGKLQTREWEKDGVKRYTTEVVAFNVIFLGGEVEWKKNDGQGAAPPARGPAPAQGQRSPPPRTPASPPDAGLPPGGGGGDYYPPMDDYPR